MSDIKELLANNPSSIETILPWALLVGSAVIAQAGGTKALIWLMEQITFVN